MGRIVNKIKSLDKPFKNLPFNNKVISKNASSNINLSSQVFNPNSIQVAGVAAALSTTTVTNKVLIPLTNLGNVGRSLVGSQLIS